MEGQRHSNDTARDNIILREEHVSIDVQKVPGKTLLMNVLNAVETAVLALESLNVASAFNT